LWLAVGLSKEMAGHESSSASFGPQRHAQDTEMTVRGKSFLLVFKDSQFSTTTTCCNCKDVKSKALCDFRHANHSTECQALGDCLPVFFPPPQKCTFNEAC